MQNAAMNYPGANVRRAPRKVAPRDPRPNGLFFKAIFALSYLFLIVASIRFVRDNPGLLYNLNVLRVGLVGGAGALWIGRSTIDRTMPLSVAIVGVLLSLYLLTDAIIAFVDVLSLLIFSAALSRSRDADKFLVYLAYGSLAVVCGIVVLATIGVLPTSVFEWDGRVKNAYGFTNPNTLFFYIFASAFTFFICKEKRGFILSGIIMAVLYAGVGSRTFGLGYVVTLIGFFVLNRSNSPILRLGLWIAILVVSIAGLLTVYFPYEVAEWSSGLFRVSSDELFSSRLSILELAHSDITPAEFWLGGLENDTDSMYNYFVASFGLLVSLVFMVATLYRVYKLSKRYGPAPLVFALTFLMIGLVEVPFDGAALMSLVFVYALFYQDRIFERWAVPRLTVRRPAAAFY